MANKYTTRKRNYEKMINKKRIRNFQDEADEGIPARLPPRNQDYLVKIVREEKANRYKPNN